MNRNADFTIDVDVPRDLVRIVMGGFFTGEDIARFVVALDRAHQLLRCPPNEHLSLVDIREMKIQAQDSVVEFQRLLANPAKMSRRLAFVVAQSLARMQIKRAAEGREARYFMNPDEAEAWLLDGKGI